MSMGLSPAIAGAPIERLIVVRLVVEVATGRLVKQLAVTVPAPIVVRQTAEARIALPTVALPRDVAATATNRDAMCPAGPVAPVPDQPDHRRSFRRSLVRVCD